MNQNIVHYSDLERKFDISKPTVSKNLSNVDSFVESLNKDIRLVRSRQRGIYFSGDEGYLLKILERNSEWHPITPKDRRMFILSSLLFKKNVTSISELVDKLFVSQRTIENDLLWVRKFIADNNGKLVNDYGTLRLLMSKDYLYAFMIYVFHDYWGDNINQSDDKNVVFPPILKNFFNEDDAKRIFRFVDSFLMKSQFRTTEYEYTSLVIYLLIQYTLFSNSKDIVKVNNLDDAFDSFEEETIELSDEFEKKFNYQFKNDQKSFLNNFMILIKSENNMRLSFDNENEISKIKKIIIGKDKRVNIYDNQFLEGLSKHISLSIKRIHFGMKIINPYTYNFKKSYPVSFEDALRLSEKINKEFNVSFNDDEIALMGMYFASLNDRKGVINKKITATIVCNTGIGTSRFLEGKIEQEMSDVISVDSVKVTHELASEKIDSDIVISTVPLTEVNKPYAFVSPFLTKEDKNKILELIRQVENPNNSKNLLENLINPNLIVTVESPGSDYKSSLLELTEQTIKYGYTDDEIFDSAIVREKLSSTAMDGMALPHGTTDHIKKPFIGVIRSRKGIEWLGDEVHIAFFMGLKGIDASQMKSIYHELNKIVESKKIINNLINAQDINGFLKYFEEDNFG
ncbi:BglG family transcription antiterminator [Companilactobacillus sp. HBUAS56275]|uniref:PTS sugar transporter subunit IIA n=1 Tax=Candidatus Companilactobacillus pullicola TaxID=2838523 RepID=A0A9D1ZKS4_9LACO|nr:PTS sugar transporter subunit IIA [Candidatus Companilactobacillus pullicola]